MNKIIDELVVDRRGNSFLFLAKSGEERKAIHIYFQEHIISKLDTVDKLFKELITKLKKEMKSDKIEKITFNFDKVNNNIKQVIEASI